MPKKLEFFYDCSSPWTYLAFMKIGNPTVFPVNSVKAMRGAFVSDEHRVIARYSKLVFESYWGDDKDISKDEVLREIVKEAGLDEREFFTKIASDEYKGRLRANVEELIARGGFGSPTMFVEGSMFFGNDRLPLVEHELTVGAARSLDEGSSGRT